MILDPNGQGLEAAFRNKILYYSWAKIRRRVNAKFARFRGIDRSSGCPGIFVAISNFVEGIEEYYTRDHDPIKGKPRTIAEWEQFWVGISSLRVLVDAVEFPDLWVRGVYGEFDVRRWLLKLTSIAKDIGVLLSVACSPRCRILFKSADFVITPLSEQKPFPWHIPLPRSQADWFKVVEIALQRRNAHLEYDDEKWIVQDAVDRDVNNLCTLVQEGKLSNATTVHCECRVMSRIVEELNLPLPRAYSYIGVSKLSCCACWEFMQAVNEIYGTTFATKGCHNKWYYPWRCPRMEREAEVRRLVHDNGAVKFSKTYYGFKSHAFSDSEVDRIRRSFSAWIHDLNCRRG